MKTKEERGSSGKPYGTPTLQDRPRQRSQQGRPRKKSQEEEESQRRVESSQRSKKVSWGVRVDEDTGCGPVEVTPVILTTAFLASYVFTSTLPNFHLQHYL